MKLVNLPKSNKSTKCICVNYWKKDRSKLITKQYNKHEYRHWYNLLIALFSKTYKIFKDTFYWPVTKLNICFILHYSNILHFAFIFSFPIVFLHTNIYIYYTTFENQIKTFPFSRHTPSMRFFVESSSAKVILIFNIEYLKLVLPFLEI